MAWIEPPRITERMVLRVLVLGFALVVALLSLAGVAAVRGTRAIEDDAAEAGREQLAMARLFNDVQAGQNTMAAILHQLAPGQDSLDRAALLRDLEAADAALAKVGASAANSPEAGRWRELDAAVKQFSSGVRQAVERGHAIRPAEMTALFEQHDRVVQLESALLKTSEKRLEATEHRIEAASRDLASNSRILLGACLVLALLCALITVAFARSAIRKMESQATELSRVSWHMLQSQESLARRFSHEMHDELGQSLAAVKANLTSGDAPARRADCILLVDQAIANVRELAQLLHPVILDDFGLDAGLRWLTEGFAQRTGIHVAYASTFAGRLNDDVETHLFRISQEALTNVARHAGASRVKVELHAAEGALTLAIEDDGRGLRTPGPAGAMAPSLGMTGMRARAQEVGGTLRLAPVAPTGLRIEVSVPLPRPEALEDQLSLVSR